MIVVAHQEELYHYGLKGMKWGVRRWQNSDGTFNTAGKERYFSDGSGDDYKKIGKHSSGSSSKSSGGSLKGALHRNMAGIYEMNEKYYSKRGNKQLASMNRTAKNDQLKRAKEADKARLDKRIEKKTSKYDKKIDKVNKEAEQILAARAKNREKLESRWQKKEAAGKMTKADVKAKKKDFDAGTAAIKKGYKKYNSTLSNYKKAKVSAITNPSSKKSQASIDAGKAYSRQKLMDNIYGRTGTVLLYSSQEAQK